MPEYSNLFVVLMGLGTVFAGLLCIILLVTLMSWVCARTSAPKTGSRRQARTWRRHPRDDGRRSRCHRRGHGDRCLRHPYRIHEESVMCEEDFTMKKYRVNVNGTVYEVELEEITGAAPAASVAAHAAAPAPAAAPAGGEKVCAPMPGNILAVNVSNGSAVKKGDVLMILEAMKMENEIMAPCDGTVTSVAAAKGAAVESGALLCTIG